MHGLLLRALPLSLAGLALTAVSAAAACDNAWTGNAGDAQYLTAGNWSAGHFPSSSENACISKDGTYTVTLSSNAGASVAVKSLTIGGGSGAQTLAIKTANGLPYVAMTSTGNSAIAANGTLVLDEDSTGVASPQPPQLSVSAGATLSNAGHIVGRVEGANDRRTQLLGAIANSGTIDVQSGLLQVGSTANTGTVHTAPGATLYANLDTSQPGFVNNGTVANEGAVDLHGTNWTQNGPVTGNPVTLQHANFVDSSGAGSFVTTNTINLSGTVAAGQTITMGTISDTDRNLVAAPNLAVLPGATIVLEGRAFGTADLLGGPVLNSGTIRLAGFNDSNRARIAGTITNQPGGLIDFASGPSQTYGAGAITNHGTVSVGAGASLLMTSGKPDLTNAADGTLRFGLSAAGNGRMSGSPLGPLAGTVTGVLADGYAPAPGTAFTVIDGASPGGAFGAVGGGFGADYPGSSVRLIVAAPAVVTPISQPVTPVVPVTPAAPVTPPAVVVHCVVPNLKGKSLSATRTALKKAHCALGKVTRPKAAKARRKAKYVKSQSALKGRSLAANAKVNVKLGPH